MAGKTAILSVRITGDSSGGVRAIGRTAAAVTGLDKLATRARTAIPNLLKDVPRLSVLAAGITSLAAVAVSGAGSIFSLVLSLASVAPAALALPGILAGVGVAAVALFAVLRDAPKVLGDLAPRFAALQDTMSAAFWKQAEGPIRNLVDTLLPTFSVGLTAVSTKLGGIATAIASAFSDPAAVSTMGRGFQDLATFLDIIGEGIGSFTSGLITLGGVGGQYLPALGSWLNGLAYSFEAWVQTNTDNGNMFQWIDTGIAGLQLLGQIAGSVVGIIGGIGKAAMDAGGATLGSLATGLESLNQAISGPLGQDTLRTIFEGANQAVTNLMPAFGAIAQMLVALAPTISTVFGLASSTISTLVQSLAGALSSPAVAGGLQTAFLGISQGIEAAAPALQALAPTLGAVLSLAGELAAAVLPIVGALITALAPVVTALATALAPVVEMIGNALLTAVQTILPPLSSLAQQLIPILGQTLTGLLTALAPVGEAILTVATTLIAQLAPIITQLISSVLPIFVQLVTQLAPVFATLLVSLVPLVTTLISQLAPVLISLITGILPPLIPVIIQVVEAVTAWVQMLSAQLIPVIQIVGGVLEWLVPIVVAVVTGIAQQVQGALQIVTGIFQALGSLISGDFAGAWTGIQKIIQGVITFVKGYIQQGLGMVAAIFGTTTDGILSKITGWATGLGQAVRTGIAVVVSTITNGMNQAKSMALGAFSALVSGVGGFIGNLLSRVRAIPGEIVSALSSLASSLTNVGRNMIQGLINGAGSMAGALTGAVKNLAGKAVNGIKSALGIHSPSRVFQQLGVFTGQGLVNGLEKMSGPASAAAASLIDIPSTAMPGITVPSASGSVVIQQGDVHLTVQGVIDDAMVRKIEAALVRVQQRRGAPAGGTLLVGRPA